jgi:ankyrin repeat protein
LHFAAQVPDGGTIAGLLVENGAVVGALDDDGRNLFYYAILQGDANRTTIHSLMNKLVEDPRTVVDGKKRNLLYYAVEAWASGADALIADCIDAGINANAPDINGTTPLHLAAKFLSAETVEFLIRKGADPYLRNNNNDNVLLFAASGGNVEVFEFLAGHIPEIDSINLSNNKGKTLLHFAAESGSTEMIRSALRYIGALEEFTGTGMIDVDAFDSRGELSLHLAVRYTSVDAVELLINRGANVYLSDAINNNIFHHAARGGNIGILRFLADNIQNWGAAALSPNNHGAIPLHYAVKSGSIEAVEFFIRSDPGAIDHDSRNLFHYAAYSRGATMFTFLINPEGPLISLLGQDNVGAMINAVAAEGNLLHSAAYAGNLPLARVLISGMMNPDLENDQGETPRGIFAGRFGISI